MKIPYFVLILFFTIAAVIVGFYMDNQKEFVNNSTSITSTTTTILVCQVCVDPTPCGVENKANYTALKTMLNIERSKNIDLETELIKSREKVAKLKNKTFNALVFANNTKDYLTNISRVLNISNQPIISKVNTSNNRLIEELNILYRG
jgi:hypothetical protein